MKNRIIILVILAMMLTNGLVLAQSWAGDTTNTITAIQSDIIYKKLEVHFSSALHHHEEFGLPSNRIEDYYSLSPIKINNLNEESGELEGFIVPILYRDEVSAIFEIHFDNYDSFATLSSDVSPEFSQLISDSKEGFVAVAVNGDLLAMLDTGLVPINNAKEELNFKELNWIYDQIYNLIYTEPELLSIEHMGINNLMALEPDEHAYVNLRWVPQVGEPWCWAATCASIINYVNGINYNAQDIIEIVSNDGGATKIVISETYKKLGLYPSQTPVLYFNEVRTQINRRNPINILVTGHSVAIKGYERYYDVADIYIIQDPNFSYNRTMDVFDRPGDMYLILNGIKRYWYWTYYDF